MSATEDAVDSRPFDLASESPDAVLCLHGLSGTPYEVRPLADALARAGFRARGPLLPGHGGEPAALARTRWRDWLDAARAEVSALEARHRSVYLVGLSMGGLLSLALAAEGRARAIAVVGTPLALRAPIPQLVPLLKRLRPFLPKTTGSDIQDPAARARHPSMRMMPLASVHELVKLQRTVREQLSRVRVPALVAHGAFDRTAQPRDAERLSRAIPGAELLWLARSGHVVPVDHDGPELAAAVVRFLRARAAASA